MAKMRSIQMTKPEINEIAKNDSFDGLNNTYHLYLKKWPSRGADSGTSSVETVLSGRHKST